MRAIAIMLLLSCACGPGPRPLPPPVPAAPLAPLAPRAVDEAAPVRRIAPGVLRGLLIEGSLRIAPDDELRAAFAHAGSSTLVAVVTVCLNETGTATTVLTGRSALPAFDRAALAVGGGWRFRPYQYRGVPTRACGAATFRHAPPASAADRPPAADEMEALPAAEIELPPAVLVEAPVSIEYRGRRATAGVAMAQVCRHRGSVAAPELAWLQSSGDAAVDQELLTRSVTAFADEPRDGALLCWVATGIVRSPGARVAPTAAVFLEPSDMGPLRIAGDRNIFPSDDLKSAIYTSGRREFHVTVDFCIDDTGRPATVTLRGSSGYVGYDMDLVNGVASWRYRPHVIDGRAVPACSLVEFAYRQK